MILAGDIGGTNTRLAFFSVQGSQLQRVAEKVYPSRQHTNLEEIVQTFLQEHPNPITHACFGIAGPVRQGRCEATNLPWIVEAQKLAQVAGLPTVGLINDLEANAYGIATLGSADFWELNAGAPGAVGNAAVIAAGTGLGEAGLYWDGKQHWPFACEGGHSSFAPRDDLQIEMLQYLIKEYGHVSWERVLCGPGLFNVYRFLRDCGYGEEPAWLRDEIKAGDPTAAVSRAGMAGTCELCVKALDLFVSLYGSEAGDMALKMMATGGVYIGGGIAPRILEKLKGPAFLEAFTAKGRLHHLVEAMPVRVILNDKTALQGSARYAALHGGLL